MLVLVAIFNTLLNKCAIALLFANVIVSRVEILCLRGILFCTSSISAHFLLYIDFQVHAKCGFQLFVAHDLSHRTVLSVL